MQQLVNTKISIPKISIKISIPKIDFPSLDYSFITDNVSFNNGMAVGWLNNPFLDYIIDFNHILPLWLVILSCFPMFIIGIYIFPMNKVETDQYINSIAPYFENKMADREPDGRIKVFLVFERFGFKYFHIWDIGRNLTGAELNDMLKYKGLVESKLVQGFPRDGVSKYDTTLGDKEQELLYLPLLKTKYKYYSSRYSFYTNHGEKLAFEQTSPRNCRFVIANNPDDMKNSQVIKTLLESKNLKDL